MSNKQLMSDKQLILCFLGGVPNSSNIISHWTNVMKDLDENIKNNLYVIEHPISFVKDYLSDKDKISFYNLFKPLNIKIVPEENHLKTGWATASLIFAELMMFQILYSDPVFSGKNFKIILLSNTCCPIYSIKYIYNTVMSSNKSYFRGQDREMFRKPKFITTSHEDFYFFSQWMILDKRHLDYFFIDSSNKAITYTKTGDNVVCNNNPITIIKSSNEAMQQYINDFTNQGTNYCNGVDEYFFALYVMQKIKDLKENHYDHIETITYAKGKCMLNDLITKKINGKTFYESLNEVFSSTQTTTTYIDHFFRNELLKQQWLYEINDSTFYVDMGKPINVIHSDNRFISNTYTCWSQVSVDPKNILRNFKIKKEHLNIKQSLIINTQEDKSKTYKWTNFNLQSFLSLNPLEAYNFLVSADDELVNNKLEKLNDRVLPIDFSLNTILIDPYAHPAEYNSWDLRSMINALILISYLRPTFTNPNMPKKDLIEFYKYIVTSYISIIENDFKVTQVEKTKTFFPIIENQEEASVKLNKKYGSFISPSDIISARISGSLFIRKCFPDSKIENYSTILSQDITYNFSSIVDDWNGLEKIISGNLSEEKKVEIQTEDYLCKINGKEMELYSYYAYNYQNKADENNAPIIIYKNTFNFTLSNQYYYENLIHSPKIIRLEDIIDKSSDYHLKKYKLMIAKFNQTYQPYMTPMLESFFSVCLNNIFKQYPEIKETTNTEFIQFNYNSKEHDNEQYQFYKEKNALFMKLYKESHSTTDFLSNKTITTTTNYLVIGIPENSMLPNICDDYLTSINYKIYILQLNNIDLNKLLCLITLRDLKNNHTSLLLKIRQEFFNWITSRYKKFRRFYDIELYNMFFVKYPDISSNVFTLYFKDIGFFDVDTSNKYFLLNDVIDNINSSSDFYLNIDLTINNYKFLNTNIDFIYKVNDTTAKKYFHNKYVDLMMPIDYVTNFSNELIESCKYKLLVIINSENIKKTDSINLNMVRHIKKKYKDLLYKSDEKIDAILYATLYDYLSALNLMEYNVSEAIEEYQKIINQQCKNNKYYYGNKLIGLKNKTSAYPIIVTLTKYDLTNKNITNLTNNNSQTKIYSFQNKYQGLIINKITDKTIGLSTQVTDFLTYNSTIFKIIKNEIPWCHDKNTYAEMKKLYHQNKINYLEILLQLKINDNNISCTNIGNSYFQIFYHLLKKESGTDNPLIDKIFNLLIADNFIININFLKMGHNYNSFFTIDKCFNNQENFLFLGWYIPFKGENLVLFKKIFRKRIFFGLDNSVNVTDKEFISDLNNLYQNMNKDRVNYNTVYSIFDYIDGHELLIKLNENFIKIFNLINNYVENDEKKYLNYNSFVHLFPDITTSLLHIHFVIYKKQDLILLSSSYNYNLQYIIDVLKQNPFYFLNPNKKFTLTMYHSYLNMSNLSKIKTHCKNIYPLI